MTHLPEQMRKTLTWDRGMGGRLLELEGFQPSIGPVGDACDNALMETINGLDKTECLRATVFHGGPYEIIAGVEYATAG